MIFKEERLRFGQNPKCTTSISIFGLNIFICLSDSFQKANYRLMIKCIFVMSVTWEVRST